MVTASGLGLDLALQRGRSQALQRLQVSILRAFIQIHGLQWPQLPSLRSLKDSRGIRRGWDPGPLPRAPSPVPQRQRGRARPSKQARTSGSGESSTSRPHPSPSLVEESSSPHLSPASRIRRPLFTRTPIPGNGDLRDRDFHGESFYDVPALTADPRFRDSMRLIMQCSLLPFMTPQQFYYPRVVLQFYNSKTSQGVPSPLELRFTIDDRPQVLRVADISATLGLPTELANSGGYREWPSYRRERWSAISLEILRRDQYSSTGSSCLRCSLWTTCSEPACSHYSTMFSAGEPYSRPCTES